MKKHIGAIITTIAIAIPAVILFIIFVLPNVKYAFRDTREFTYENVTRVRIQSGLGMSADFYAADDPETVDRLARDTVRGKFAKGDKLEPYGGYSYILNWYDGTTLVDELTIFGKYSFDHDGYLYTADARDGAQVDTDYLDELLYTALQLDELLTYGTPFVDDLLRDFPRDRIVSLYGEPSGTADSGASVYATDARTLYVNYADDRVSSVWIADNASAETLAELFDRGLSAVGDALIGLTRAEVTARYGAPNGILEISGEEIYEVNGKQERILLTYESDTVVSLDLYTTRYGGEEIPVFDYAADSAQYDGDPGVKHDGFVNTEEQVSMPFKPEDVIEYAARECTVEYDSVGIAIDEQAEMWRVIFCTEGVAGGDQSVYLDAHSGRTLLIVYGE